MINIIRGCKYEDGTPIGYLEYIEPNKIFICGESPYYWIHDGKRVLGNEDKDMSNFRIIRRGNFPVAREYRSRLYIAYNYYYPIIIFLDIDNVQLECIKVEDDYYDIYENHKFGAIIAGKYVKLNIVGYFWVYTRC